VRNKPDPLLAAWEKTVARHGGEPAIFDTLGSALFRFQEIESLSREYEIGDSGLASLKAGEILAIQVGNHPHWPALFLACLRRGVVVLPVEKTVSDTERASALQTCRVAGLLSEVSRPIEPLHDRRKIDWQGPPPVLLKLTSGTTAEPRAIRFRSGQLLADAIQICETMGIGADDLNFAVIPISHSYGFSNLITPLLVRGVPMVMSRDRIPRAVLDDLARTKATVFPGMPLFYQAFVEMEEIPSLGSLRLCISAGAPLSTSLARRFRQKFGLPIHSFYGASECGGICYDRETKHEEEEGFVGPPLRGVELEPVEQDSAVTQVQVRSAAVGDGYFPRPEPSKLGHGIFLPDDLVRLTEAGVRIVGRTSDVINVAGKKVNPAEVEAQLLSHPAVRQAVVFGRASTRRNEEVVACVVAAEETGAAELLDFCRTRLSGWQTPKQIFLVEALPVNERGKISRRQLARHFGQ
jgi:acyl-CoA synthetase (AMP-forming)/AMP-acid ligase II